MHFRIAINMPPSERTHVRLRFATVAAYSASPHKPSATTRAQHLTAHPEQRLQHVIESTARAPNESRRIRSLASSGDVLRRARQSACTSHPRSAWRALRAA
jgi:hypothetical protein